MNRVEAKDFGVELLDLVGQTKSTAIILSPTHCSVLQDDGFTFVVEEDDITCSKLVAMKISLDRFLDDAEPARLFLDGNEVATLAIDPKTFSWL